MAAYADESRRQGPSGLCYIVGAAVVVTDDEDDARDAIRKLLLPRQEYIHWRDEGRKRRAVIVEALSELDLLVISAYCYPVAKSREEIARQRCLENLADVLNTEGIDEVVIESRDPSQDREDSATLTAARLYGMAPNLHYKHARKPSDPLLWLADVVAAVVGLHVTEQDPSYLSALHPAMQVVNRVRL